MNSLDQPAPSAPTGAGTVGGMATAEGWDADRYALALAHNIREDGLPLDVQRERLAALVGVASGLSGPGVTAEELARHLVILQALFDRFALTAGRLASREEARTAEAATRMLSGAVQAQRAALSVMSALQVLQERSTGGRAAPSPVNASDHSPDTGSGTRSSIGLPGASAPVSDG